MEANELRIGNWYWWNAEGKNYEYQVKARDFGGDNIKNFEPIPLTEDWLVRFGYKKQAYRGVWYHPDLNNAPVLTIEEDGLYYEYTKIEFVHHFQNLCFALTGQELELKSTEK
jgi:hypothetical protein